MQDLFIWEEELRGKKQNYPTQQKSGKHTEMEAQKTTFTTDTQDAVLPLSLASGVSPKRGSPRQTASEREKSTLIMPYMDTQSLCLISKVQANQSACLNQICYRNPPPQRCALATVT